MEAADRNAKYFKTTDSIAIRKVSTTFHQSHPPGGASGDTRRGSCRQCGRSNHSPGDCHYKNAECHNCSKRGHIALICRGKPESKHKPEGSKKKFSKKKFKKAHWVAEQVDSNPEELQIHAIGGYARPIHVTVDINDVSLSMELDTGAAVSLISEQQ